MQEDKLDKMNIFCKKTINIRPQIKRKRPALLLASGLEEVDQTTPASSDSRRNLKTLNVAICSWKMVAMPITIMVAVEASRRYGMRPRGVSAATMSTRNAIENTAQ